MASLTLLINEIEDCRVCERDFGHEPRPVVRAEESAKIVIAGQAPGLRVHKTGIPFNDPSGVRLRHWMGISEEKFYEKNHIAITPMAFCYPGTGSGGDFPPPPVCAKTWRQPILDALPNIEFTLLIGKYAIDWHLGKQRDKNLGEIVKRWESTLPGQLAIPHPSPRNNRWLKNNPWFEAQCVPLLRDRIQGLLE